MYVIENDFKQLIQTENLGQLTGGLSSVLSSCISKAITEVGDYLRQKHDLSIEFKTMSVYSFSATYKAGDRVYLDAVAFSSTATYAANALVIYSSGVYKAKTSLSAGAWNAANWDMLGSQYDYFYAQAPKQRFEFDAYYKKNDEVFHKDKTYTATTDSQWLSQSGAIQYNQTANYPTVNNEPGTPNGLSQWGTGTSYSFVGQLPSNTTYFTKGDNRNQVIMGGVIDVALYHLHSRIAPRNIPDLRVKRYDDFIAYLRMIAKGSVSTELPLIEPKQGRLMRMGGVPKQVNR